MTNPELDQLLKSAPIPERETEYWDAFPAAITRQLGHRGSSSFSLPTRRSVPRLAWAMGLATAGLVIGFALGFWRGRDTAPEPAQLAAMRKYFTEISALFPNQIRAIVVDDQGPRLLLADQPNLPNAQPLFLKICGPKGCQQVVTFSGQRIPLNGELCDVLLNGQGQVLVAGRRWLWAGPATTVGPARYRIQAQLLEAAL